MGVRYLYEYQYQGKTQKFSVTDQNEALDQIADFEMDDPENITELKFIRVIVMNPIIACEGCES